MKAAPTRAASGIKSVECAPHPSHRGAALSFGAAVVPGAAAGVTNCVDVICAGGRPTEASAASRRAEDAKADAADSAAAAPEKAMVTSTTTPPVSIRRRCAA